MQQVLQTHTAMCNEDWHIKHGWHVCRYTTPSCQSHAWLANKSHNLSRGLAQRRLFFGTIGQRSVSLSLGLFLACKQTRFSRLPCMVHATSAETIRGVATATISARKAVHNSTDAQRRFGFSWTPRIGPSPRSMMLQINVEFFIFEFWHAAQTELRVEFRR